MCLNNDYMISIYSYSHITYLSHLLLGRPLLRIHLTSYVPLLGSYQCISYFRPPLNYSLKKVPNIPYLYMAMFSKEDIKSSIMSYYLILITHLKNQYPFQNMHRGSTQIVSKKYKPHGIYYPIAMIFNVHDPNIIHSHEFSSSHM